MSSESFDSELVQVALSLARHFGARSLDAEDIAQEALLKLVTYRDSIADPVAWLYVVVRRLQYRQSRRPSLREPERLIPGVANPWPAIELSIDTRRLLPRLPDRARKSVCLAFEGYTEREMARELGCSIKATEKSLGKARRRMRSFLKSSS